MINTKKLKARMVELDLGQKTVADALKIAQATLSQKLNGIRPMYLDEAEALADLLEIEDDQFGSYFFSR